MILGSVLVASVFCSNASGNWPREPSLWTINHHETVGSRTVNSVSVELRLTLAPIGIAAL